MPVFKCYDWQDFLHKKTYEYCPPRKKILSENHYFNFKYNTRKMEYRSVMNAAENNFYIRDSSEYDRTDKPE